METTKSARASQEWQRKWAKAILTLVFHFDDLDDVTAANFERQVEQVGASVDPFFSIRVSHVITSCSTEVIEALLSNPDRTFTKKSVKGPSDVLRKAARFNIKIWPQDKLRRMLDRLCEDSLPKEPVSKATRDLNSLLHEEQLYGTRERDPFVPHPDFHYFADNARYLLVEDRYSEHRPIAIREFEPPKKGADPAWPVLWGGVDGKTAFYHYRGPPIQHRPAVKPSTSSASLQRRASALDASGRPAARRASVSAAPDAAPLGAPLQRSVSLNKQLGHKRMREATQNAAPAPTGGSGNTALPLASGNSQTLTSTVASATSHRSGAVNGSSTAQNRRFQELQRHTVTMRAHAAGKLHRSISMDTGLHTKLAPPPTEPKRPGYCENCRVKYEDFKTHIKGTKHRRFATNAANWADLDDVLRGVQRWPRSGVADDSGFFENEMYSSEASSLEIMDEE